MRQHEQNFISNGLRCDATLYLPDKKRAPPVIIMAHGLGAERSFGLLPYVKRFVSEGFAVFVFDYRNFGESEGEPRNLVDPWRHIEDYDAAIARVKKMKVIDAKNICLWGTSFSGGHVLVAAAKNKNIKAVIAQIPEVDGWASGMTYGIGYMIKGICHALADDILSIFGKGPHYVKIYSGPDEFAVLNKPDSTRYAKIIPKGAKWENSCPARILLQVPFYRPMTKAHDIACPVLLVYAENDTLIPPISVERTAKHLKDCRTFHLPIGHFDVYGGKPFEQIIYTEIEFLNEKMNK